MFRTSNKIQYTLNSHNIVFDGNSIFAGVGAGTNEARIDWNVGFNIGPAAMKSAVGQYQISANNVAIAGQTDAQIRSNATDIQSKFVAGRQNIIIYFEGTNSIATGVTGVTAAQTALGYCADRKADNPAWLIMLVGTIPRGGVTLTQKQYFYDYNNYLKNNLSPHADLYVDLQLPNSPFNLSDWSDAAMDATGYYASPDRTHPSPAGHKYIAERICEGLRRLTAKDIYL
jgi:lysophospholipase L1-like esterase